VGGLAISEEAAPRSRRTRGFFWWGSISLGVHSGAFTEETLTQLTTPVDNALANANHVSIFTTGFEGRRGRAIPETIADLPRERRTENHPGPAEYGNCGTA
jgi:hypothetical protein